MSATIPSLTEKHHKMGGTTQGSEKARNGIPPLEPGDHLTRVEFERRYEAMPQQTKAELIEGIVYMPSPVRYSQHSRPHGVIMAWLVGYALATPGLGWADNASLRLDYDNEPQPDAILFVEETYGGICRVSSDDYLEGTPELIAEVAASTVSYDMHEKMRIYRRNGVQEYLVLLTLEEKALWHALEEGEYRLIEPNDQGVLCSRVFPGLWLHPEHFWAGNLAGLMAVLDEGAASQEHVAFVAELARQGEGAPDRR